MRITLSGPSRSLSLAVSVTRPVLCLEPAVIVSVRFVDSVKSPATAGSIGSATTVSVTSSSAVLFMLAEIVLVPPFSEIVAGSRSNDTRGPEGPSMKSIVMVVGFPTANITPSGNVPKVITTPWPSSTRSSSWAQTPSPVRVSFSQNLALPGP